MSTNEDFQIKEDKMDEAKGSYDWQCMECGKKFNKDIGKNTLSIKCPKCGSEDIDIYVEGGYKEGIEDDEESRRERQKWAVYNFTPVGSNKIVYFIGRESAGQTGALTRLKNSNGNLRTFRSYKAAEKVLNKMKEAGDFINTVYGKAESKDFKIKEDKMNESTTVISSWLPVFSGFYGTIWDQSENAYYSELEHWKGEFPELEIDEDDLEMQDEEYELCVCEGATSFIEAELVSIVPAITAIKFDKQVSPKEYNFANDVIYIDVTIDVPTFSKWFGDYLQEHGKEFEDYISERYTSYDGFMSHYDNTVDAWRANTKNWSDLGGHELGALLEFICRIEGIDEMAMYESAMDNCGLSATLSDEKQKEADEIIAHREEKAAYDKKQTDFDFDGDVSESSDEQSSVSSGYVWFDIDKSDLKSAEKIIHKMANKAKSQHPDWKLIISSRRKYPTLDAYQDEYRITLQTWVPREDKAVFLDWFDSIYIELAAKGIKEIGEQTEARRRPQRSKTKDYGAKQGIGRGVGRLGGLRRNQNTEPCPDGGVGVSRGLGFGKGKNRVESIVVGANYTYRPSYSDSLLEGKLDGVELGQVVEISDKKSKSKDTCYVLDPVTKILLGLANIDSLIPVR